MKPARLLLGQALFVTFLWSISKIIIKFGLVMVSPYALLAGVQVVAFLALLIYYWIKKPKFDWQGSRQQITVLILIGVAGFIIAPLFAVVGLKYATGMVVGLFSGLNVILVALFSGLILHEKPTAVQVIGLAIAFTGASVFLAGEKWNLVWFGMLLILLSELAYALNTVLTRLIAKMPGDQTMLIALFGSAIGAIFLLPVGMLSGDMVAVWQGPTLIAVLTMGLIFAFAGLMWNAALAKLKSIEASILQNTMLFQIVILAFIFLNEAIKLQHILGGIMVLVGAYLIESKLIHNLKNRNVST